MQVNKKLSIFTMMSLVFLDIMGVGLIVPLIPYLITNPNGVFYNSVHSDSIRLFLFGLNFAAWGIGAFFGASYMGDLSDKLGRKMALVLSSIAALVLYGFMYASIVYHNLSLFMAARLMFGFFSANFVIAQAAVVDLAETDTQRTKYISLVAMAATLGFTGGPMISFINYIISGSSQASTMVHAPFLIAMGLSSVNLIMLFLFVKRDKPKDSVSKRSWSDVFSKVSNIFQDKRVNKIAVDYFLIQLIYSIFFANIILIMTDQFGFNYGQLSLFFIFFAMGGFIGNSLNPIAIKCFGNYNSLRFLSLGFVILLATIPLLSKVPYLAYPVVMMAMVMEFTVYVNLTTAASKKVAKTEQGLILGGLGSIFSLTVFVANFFIVSPLLHLSIYAPYVVAIICGVILFVRICARKNLYSA